MSIFAIAQDMYENDKYMEGLNETQKTSLESILSAKGSQVSQMALALLMRDNPDYQYTELVLQPSENSSRIAPKENKLKDSKMSFFKLYPNPTTDYFTLEYQFDATIYSNLQMEIYDASGRKIISQNLNNSDNATLIDVSALSKGVYNVSFIADGNVLSVEKLTIVK
jgi:hypothetical protein